MRCLPTLNITRCEQHSTSNEHKTSIVCFRKKMEMTPKNLEKYERDLNCRFQKGKIQTRRIKSSLKKTKIIMNLMHEHGQFYDLRA